MKRASTVRKVTVADMRTIATGCEVGDYVMVRYRGESFGIVATADNGRTLVSIDGDNLPAAKCTVRRQTVERLRRALYAMRCGKLQTMINNAIDYANALGMSASYLSDGWLLLTCDSGFLSYECEPTTQAVYAVAIGQGRPWFQTLPTVDDVAQYLAS